MALIYTYWVNIKLFYPRLEFFVGDDHQQHQHVQLQMDIVVMLVHMVLRGIMTRYTIIQKKVSNPSTFSLRMKWICSKKLLIISPNRMLIH